MCVRRAPLEFGVIRGLGQRPDGWSFVEVAGVAVDSHDRDYVFNRCEYPVIVPTAVSRPPQS